MLDNATASVATVPEYYLIFGHWMPVHPWEKASLDADVQEIAAARKAEKKLFEKIKNTCTFEVQLYTGARACTDPPKFKKWAKTYLQSLWCLIAAMLEDNKKTSSQRSTVAPSDHRERKEIPRPEMPE